MRQCGSCTLCCKVLGVGELNKPKGQWCPHCSIGVGCGIYKQRPTECINFDCSWLLGKVPEDLKPNMTNVVLADLQLDVERANPGIKLDDPVIIVYSDPDTPDAYKTGKMQEYLDSLLKQGIALIIVRGDEKLLMKHGSVKNDETFTKSSITLTANTSE